MISQLFQNMCSAILNICRVGGNDRIKSYYICNITNVNIVNITNVIKE